ncbi:MAG TPA: hypothetical protein VK174_01900, partial [Chitinophagales bacterium]|nr:hypothetical protein [Chitinophagales bacterium]
SHVQDALPNCTKCHTGGNLFETVFKNDADKERVIEGIKNGNDYSALPRESSSWVTGVDCITCHYNGKNVVTSANFIKSPGKPGCPDFCNPAPSVLFSSNMTCYPCHQEQVVSMDGYPSKEVACSSCHGEKDADAKLTHYTYWAHNPIGRVTPPSLNIFNGINASYSKNNHAVQIVWMNEVLPHMRSVCTELVAVVEVSKNNSTVKSDTIRINQKSYHDKQLAPWFKDRPVPGCSGTEFKHLNDSIVRFISLPPSLKHADLEVNIIGYKKEQYWLSDSMRSVYMQKKVVLHL